MKRLIFSSAFLLSIALLISCGQAPESEKVKLYQQNAPLENAEQAMDKAPVNPKEALLSSSAADTQKDSGRLMVRTANLRFRVINVAEATYELERLVGEHGGQVTYTHLQSENRGTSHVRIHPDSTLEVHRFSVSNNIVIRIPDSQLDGLLRSLVPLVDYLDYRTIRAEDKTLDFLRNRLAEKRAKSAHKAYANDPRSKGQDQYEAEQHHKKREQMLRQADAAQLANRLIEEQAALGTFTLQLYQREERSTAKLYTPDDPPSYEAPASARIGISLSTGWNVLVELLLFIVQSWGLIVLSFAAVFGFRFARTQWRKYYSKKS